MDLIPQWTIIVCGASTRDHRDLLRHFSKVMQADVQGLVEDNPPLEWHYLDVVIHDQMIRFMYYLTSTFHIDDQLQRADAIIYMVKVGSGIDMEIQATFSSFTRAAERLKRTWRDIPWLWVESHAMFSAGKSNPLTPLLPTDILSGFIPCSFFLEPSNLEAVWQQVLTDLIPGGSGERAKVHSATFT